MALTFLAAGPARADLLPALELETGLILPRGTISPRLKFLSTGADQRFDGTGRTLSLAASLQRPLRWGDVIAAQPNETGRATLRALLGAAPAIAESDLAGTLTADVSSSTTAFVPVLFWGVTERLNLGAALPLVHAEVRAATGFSRGASVAPALARARAMLPPEAYRRMAAQLDGALAAQLSALGYEPLQSRTVDAPGDLRLYARYALDYGAYHSLVVKPMALFPTGNAPNPDRLADAATGEGRYQLGTTVVYERHDGRLPLPGWKANVYASYQAALGDSPTLRVPTARSFLSADKEAVERGMSHRFATGAGMAFAARSLGTTLGLGYHVQYQTGESFRGKRFESARYQLLEKMYPEQWLQSATITLGLNTVEWYRAKRFPLPMEATLTFDKAVAGRNTAISDILTAEVVVYL